MIKSFLLFQIAFGLENIVDDCKDKDDVLKCQYLQQNGACESHADVMANKCARTCKLCGKKTYIVVCIYSVCLVSILVGKCPSGKNNECFLCFVSYLLFFLNIRY